MASEAKRGFRRMAANYIRLAITFSQGLILTPLLIAWLGWDAYGLVVLLGAGFGLALIPVEITNQSMVRELGAAYHSGDRALFREVYNTAYVIVGVVTIITAALCTLAIIFVDRLLDIPPAWLRSAQWFLAAQIGYALIAMLISPAFSMYRVKEQFGHFNFWLTATRLNGIIAAGIVAGLMGVRDTADAILLYGVVWGGLMSAVSLIPVAWLMFRDRDLLIRPWLVRRRHFRQTLHTFGWNSSVFASINLQERIPAVIMNLAFGVSGNAMYGVAFQLVSYVRILTVGVSFGLDAVAARLSATSHEGLRILTHHATRINSMVALGAAALVGLLVQPILFLWIGARLKNPEQDLPPTGVMVQILLIPLVTRAVSDGWIMVLYGAGYVRQYAPLILVGAVAGPLLSIALLHLLPPPYDLYAPALGYALTYTVIMLLVLPRIVRICLSVRYRDVLAPMLRPALATALCLPILIAAHILIHDWLIWHLLAVFAGYGLAYAATSWLIVLSPNERKRFGGAAYRTVATRLS